jgi:hypothetical protein
VTDRALSGVASRILRESFGITRGILADFSKNSRRTLEELAKNPRSHPEPIQAKTIRKPKERYKQYPLICHRSATVQLPFKRVFYTDDAIISTT